MGPIALFDKSFLEGLNIDEAVLFDYFFYPNVCPVFFVETLGDLDKLENRGRLPEDVVGAIAFKSPQMHGGPNTFHRTLAMANLRGQTIPMSGQIAVSGGIPVRSQGQRHVVFKPSPETEAFNRWQRGEFEQVERLYARQWRESLRTLDLKLVAAQAERYGLNFNLCKTIADAKAFAEQVIDGLVVEAQIRFAIDKFDLPAQQRDAILAAWREGGSQPLSAHAPYAYFVLRLMVFFEIALATGKISTERPSNINDLAYLFYLPFSMVFVSSDRLHRSCAPLFLRPDQEFLWGPDLKADLRANHEALMQLPEEQKLQGLIKLHPAPLPDSQIAQLHARLLRPRQAPMADEVVAKASPLVERVRRLSQEADAARGAPPDFAPGEADSITIERMVSKKRGSWFQVPHDTKPTDR